MRSELEKQHDEKLAYIQKQLNEENIKRATELRATTTEYGAVAKTEKNAKEKQLMGEIERARIELDKKQKSVKSKKISATSPCLFLTFYCFFSRKLETEG